MSDTYLAIYNATKNSLGNCDVHGAVSDAAFRQFDISHLIGQAQGILSNIEVAHTRPHVLMRPALSCDGSKWCALYGDNLQEGVAGFGDTPEQAMYDFDRNWSTLPAIAR